MIVLAIPVYGGVTSRIADPMLVKLSCNVYRFPVSLTVLYSLRKAMLFTQETARLQRLSLSKVKALCQELSSVISLSVFSARSGGISLSAHPGKRKRIHSYISRTRIFNDWQISAANISPQRCKVYIH